VTHRWTATVGRGAIRRSDGTNVEDGMTADDVAPEPGSASQEELARRLGAAFPDDPERLRALGERLAVAAERDGVLDVAHRTLDTPVGELLIAATPEGVVRVAYAVEDHDAVLHQLAARVSPRLLRAPARLDPLARQLDEYFAGRRRRFEVAIDWRLSAGFRRAVLHHLASDVGYGQTASYATLARLAGSPKAVRAVGTACATNPLPVVVPCHRVVRSDGAMGGYLGGPDAKRTLLALEAAR
jgi:methylated-DNA-[protein]-cysteine S-methyltransferase